MRAKLLFIILTLLASVNPHHSQSQTGIQTVHPVEHNAPLTNPYMGFGLWAGPRYYDGRPFSLEYNTAGFGEDAPLFGWVLVDWMWSDLEPQEGKYSWNDLDTILRFWSQRGKQIYLRVWITDDPGWDGAPGNEVCPEWLWKAGAKYRSYTGEGKAPKREPDYMDPSYERIYLPKARKFLEALAARYDKPEGAVVLWGAMGYGQWGEWHTMWSHYPWPDKHAKHAVLAKIVTMYAEVFKVQPVMISYCFDDDRQQVASLDDFFYRQALDVAMSRKFALARHGFIDGLLLWDRLTMEKYWRSSVLMAEGDWSYLDVKNHGTHGTLAENIEVMAEWHSNYAHFYMDAEGYRRAIHEDRAAFEKGLQKGGIGYRLVPLSLCWPEELRAGELLLVRSKWANRNQGRLYIRHPLRLYLTDSNGAEKFSAEDPSFDATGWIQGEEYPVTSIIGVPGKLAPGAYDLRIALTGPRGKPAIQLPIEGRDPQGRYRLGSIRILPARGK